MPKLKVKTFGNPINGTGRDDALFADDNSGAARMNGGGGHDRITGSDRGDRINAGDGNDTVLAGGGNDTVIAGDGNDEIKGGEGDDVINPVLQTFDNGVSGGPGEFVFLGS